MQRKRPSRLVAASAAALAITAFSISCSSDGGTPPNTVTTVVITAPVAGPSFQTLGRTVQFAAEPRNSSDEVVPGVAVSWSSSNSAVASVSGTGLVTALLNGTTQIQATAAGVPSAQVTVTVSQVADATVITPGSVAFGAIGSTRQLAAGSEDSSGAAIPGLPSVTWTSLGDGATASVSVTGLVTAVDVGTSDTAVATIGTKSAKAPISVTQVPASILVTSGGADTIFWTGDTRTFSAAVSDSQANPMAGQSVVWSSTMTGVATVATDGIATAIADGASQIRATLGAVIGERALTVRRYATVFDLAPGTASITTAGGTQGFTIDARDSADVTLPAAWLSRNTAVATVAPATGAATTATATGDGTTFIVVSAGTRTDSADVTVTGQPPLATTANVRIYDFYFLSTANATQNPAVDTIAVGGEVTWTWYGAVSHSAQSIGDPSFTSSTLKTTGTYQVTFNAVGTYQYQCEVHSLMTGQIVVR
jgi:plastocyanin